MLGLDESDYGAAQDALGRSLEIARREKESGLELRTLVFAAEVDLFHHRWDQGQQRSLDALELISQVEDPRSEMLAHYWTALGFMAKGEFDVATHHMRASLVPAERLRHRFYLPRALWGNELLSRINGDWQTARQFAERGLEVSPREPRLLMARALSEY